MKVLSGLFIIFFITTLTNKGYGQKKANNVISVEKFGALGNGVHDDGPAIEKALNYCKRNHKVCFIPKTTKFYNISATIRVDLLPGESISIISNHALIKPLILPLNKSAYNLTLFKEHIIMSIGRLIDSLSSNMFSRSANSSVNIRGLDFNGEVLPNTYAPTSYNSDILIGLQVLAENVSITNCKFKNIYGYGIRVHNVRNSSISNSNFEQVGGRGATLFGSKVDRDAFGDAIYHALVKTNGKVSITNCIIEGKIINKTRSRSAVTFEYSREPYTIELNKLKISNFAKCIHIEEKAMASVYINSSTMSNFNIALANVLNDRSKIYFNKDNIYVGNNDGNESGDVLAFLNYQSKAKVYVNNSLLDFNGRVHNYQSAVGLVLVKNSVINGHNSNTFFADGNTVFDHVKFIAFGGAEKSFFSLGGNNTYQLLNCTFLNCGKIDAQTNTKLVFRNNSLLK